MIQSDGERSVPRGFGWISTRQTEAWALGTLNPDRGGMPGVGVRRKGEGFIHHFLRRRPLVFHI